MAEKSQEKKKTSKATGKRKGRISTHFTRAPMKKLRRVLKTSGLPAGQAYLKAWGMNISPAAVNLIAEPRWATRDEARRARAVTRRQRYETRRAKRDADRAASAQARAAMLSPQESIAESPSAQLEL